MNRNSLQGWLVVGLTLLAFAAPAAQAGTRPNDRSDVISRYLHSHASSRGVSPADAPVPDAFERYAAAHPYGVGLVPTTVAGSTAFDWGDYGAGVGTGIGVFLVLAGVLIAMPARRRQRTEPVIS